MKEKGMETFHSALIKRFPIKISENIYEFELDNEIQKNYIETHIDEFHAFLRKELNNFSISIKLIITKNENLIPKYLNGKEKFDLISGKNPNLMYLKNSLDLDVEF